MSCNVLKLHLDVWQVAFDIMSLEGVANHTGSKLRFLPSAQQYKDIFS
jgi:hypothetical protein